MDYKKVIEKIPYNPGVYLMKDKDFNIIYIGKAKSLKKRVRQYFNKSNKTTRILKMVEQIEHIEYIITENEAEALVLECNYIKEHMPKYNVMLKDDKTYPYIKITIKDDYPIIFSTRRKQADGSIYLGPYTDVSSMNNSLKLVKEIFPLKRCKYNLNKACNKKVGPCLYYHIGRCMGPCINDIKREEYKDMIDQVIMFLEGKTKEIETLFVKQIEEYIQKLEFEKANILKQRLESVRKLKNKQNVGNVSLQNTDVWGYVLKDNMLYIQVFKVRDSNISSHENMVLEEIQENNILDTILSIIPQYYYKENIDMPKEIVLKIEDSIATQEEIKVIKEGLFKVKGKKIDIKIPKKGKKLKYINMVESNINMKLATSKVKSVELLKELLNIDYDMNTIEAYDISNLRNDYIVGTYITFEDNKLNKNKYRKFKIKSTNTQNDFISMQEVIQRRLNHVNEWDLPDLIAIDGGSLQVNAAKDILQKNNIDIPVIGMIKDSNHRTRGIIDLDGNEIDFRNKKEYKQLFNFITFLQDEVHRFTISYHRKLRDKID